MCGGGETSRRQLVHIRLIRVIQKFAHPNSIQIIATNQLCEWIQRKSNLFLTLKLDFTSVDYSICNNIQTFYIVRSQNARSQKISRKKILNLI